MYDFSSDWFTPHIPVFESLLKNLKGKPCRLLEIGSWEGRSSVWLLENMATHPEARLDIVDVSENPKLRPNLCATGSLDKTTLHIGPSNLMLRSLPVDTYDFIYIDGSHATISVMEDAVQSFLLLKRNGIMAFDDYLWDDNDPAQPGRPREAINAFLKIYSHAVELLHRRRQVWIRKTPSHLSTKPNFATLATDWLFYQFHRLRPGKLRQVLMSARKLTITGGMF